MLNKILASMVLVLVLSLGSVSYLYVGSLKENGLLTGRIETLVEDNNRCADTVEKLKKENEDVIQSFENLQKKNQEIEDTFSGLEDELLKKRCKPLVSNKAENHVKTEENDAVSIDIADTYRVLRSAYCLSNRDSSCDNSRELLQPLSTDTGN